MKVAKHALFNGRDAGALLRYLTEYAEYLLHDHFVSALKVLCNRIEFLTSIFIISNSSTPDQNAYKMHEVPWPDAQG